jgi:hypothetical protein
MYDVARFRDLGVNAADSKWWLYDYDPDSRRARDDQLVDVVVQTARERSPSLTEAFTTHPPRHRGARKTRENTNTEKKHMVR